MSQSVEAISDCTFFGGKYAANFICNYREADPWWFYAPGFNRKSLVKLVNSNITVVPPGSHAWYQSASIKICADRSDGMFPRMHSDSIKILVFSGTNPQCPDDLGADISFTVEDETHCFSTPCIVAVPKNLRYGEILTRNFRRPYILTELLPEAEFNGCSLQELEMEPCCPHCNHVVPLHGGKYGMLFMPYGDQAHVSLTAGCSPFGVGRRIELYVKLVSEPEGTEQLLTADADSYISLLSTDGREARILGGSVDVVFQNERRKIELSSMVFVPKGAVYSLPRITALKRPVLVSIVKVYD